MATAAKEVETPTSAGSNIQVEASDIQAIVLRPRPKPYRGEYVILRVGDAGQGREMLRRILPHVAPADEWWVPSLPGWLGIAFTFEGLKALGVPQASLDSFPIEFRQGMAARAAILHDFGANAPPTRTVRRPWLRFLRSCATTARSWRVTPAPSRTATRKGSGAGPSTASGPAGRPVLE